jgi:hypothetical protein
VEIDELINRTRSGGKKLMRALRLTCGALALAALVAPVANAQDTAEVRRLTILTFSEPVQLPGKTLPAGKYRFEMADVNNAAHVVRVLSEDGQTVIGTFHTVASTQPQRDLQAQDTLVMFAERPAGQPQAAKEWYYPGRSIGEEFIYPKDQAQTLAKLNKTSVPVEEDGKVTRVDGSEPAASASASNAPAASSAPAAAPASTPAQSAPQSTTATNRPASAAQAPTERPAPSNSAVGTAGQAPAAAQNQSAAPARTLPRTASSLYLFELLSVLSIAAAFGVRQLRLRAAQR